MVSVGIMNVTRSMQKVQYLSRLRQRAEEGIVAAGSFLLLVESHCRAFRMALGRLDGTIEVQCDPRQAELGDPFQNKISQQPAEFGDRLLVCASQHPTDRGDIRKAAEPEYTLHQRVVAVVLYISQFTKPKYDMKDQLEEDGGAVVDLALGQVAKALLQTHLERNELKEPLKHYQSSEGRQSLVFKAQCRDGSGFHSDASSAILHL